MMQVLTSSEANLLIRRARLINAVLQFVAVQQIGETKDWPARLDTLNSTVVQYVQALERDQWISKD